MRTFKHLIVAAALALVAGIVAPPPANAQQVILCPSARESNSATRQLSLPNLSKTYAADSSGCVIASGTADIAILTAAGYAQEAPYRSLVFNTGVATGTTDFAIGILPPGAFVQSIVVSNSTANAVTSNISIGTTANGTDVVASLACGANCVASAPGTTTIAKAAFSTTAATTLHMAAIGAWNSANVTVTVVWGYF